MPAAHVTPRVFLSKWWLIRYNKTDAALCRKRHFDKWCSHSSLHQAHSKALRLVGILLKTSNMHQVPVQNKHKVFCDPYVSESFWGGISLTVIFSTLSWVEEDLKNVALDLCCCCPALLSGYRAMPAAHSHNGDTYFISLSSALRKQPESVGDVRTVPKATSDSNEISSICLLPKNQDTTQK